jgi:hypothetical protein
MGKINKKTQEQFIAEVIEEHEGYYSYPRTVYTRSIDKIIVTCPEHGDFLITADKHSQGQGCRKCAFIRLTDAKRDSKEVFIEKSLPRHGTTYDYSLVVIVDDATKVDIICHKHGVFSMTPRAHKRGNGCPQCARERIHVRESRSMHEHIINWESTYSGKYDYSKVDLSAKGNTLVEIVCPIHGSFWRTPHRHSSGRGCAKCAEFGFNKGKPASFYILLSDNITKVGVTNRGSQDRVKGVNRSSGLNFSAHTVITSEDGNWIHRLEQNTLAWLRERYKGVESKFDGYTECFVDVCLEDLLNRVAST